MDTSSPYQPPAMPPPPPGPREPGAIKVFGVIHLVLAGLGLLGGLWNLASPFVTRMLIPKNNPSFEVQMRIQDSMKGFTIAGGILGIGLGVLLLISGLKLVRSRPDGVKWSAIYSWSSIGSKLAMLVVTMVWLQPRMRAAMRELMEASKDTPGADAMFALMEPIMGVSMVITPLIYCTYPLLALYFLSRPPVKAWIAGRSQGAS
jgi:hypothetical protein